MLRYEEILLFRTQVAAAALKGTSAGSINEDKQQIRFGDLIIHRRFL
jgi:hypothetical protein